jgi:hypothetical protein
MFIASMKALCCNLFVLFFSIFLISCNNDNDKGIQPMADEKLHLELYKIQNKKIFFGHQSVGNDIIQGMKDIQTNYDDIRLNFISINNTSLIPDKYFADAYIGENTKPDSKCDAFAQKIDRIFSGQLDVAFMKFCYVDINAGSNAESVFSKYQSAIESLKSKYPQIVFVHVTIPFVTKASGLKHFIKSLLGYSANDDIENIKRNIFNSLLTQHYTNEPIFDLAAVESTYPDGRRESFTSEGKTYYTLIKDYTDDGGHLNKTGRKLAAMKLIEILAKAIDAKTHELLK